MRSDMMIPTYPVEHWTTVLAEPNYQMQAAKTVTVNDRAATRQAIITAVRRNGFEFIERSGWAAHKNKSDEMIDDWNYTKIAIHHAGRSFSCGPAALQMQEIQNLHMGNRKWSDIGYHYAADCFGNIYEGRDIRFKGAHLDEYNTGVIGIVFLENLSEPEDSHDRAGAILSILKRIGLGRDIVVPSIQKENIKKFIAILRQAFSITTLGGHQEFPKQNSQEARLCPGMHGIKLVKELRSWGGLSQP